MGQKFNDNSLYKMSDLICNKCFTHLLIELIQVKNNAILIRRYCFCDTLTAFTSKDCNLWFLRNNLYHEIKCQQITKLKGCGRHGENNYCTKCSNFLCNECTLTHEHKDFIELKTFLNN